MGKSMRSVAVLLAAVISVTTVFAGAIMAQPEEADAKARMIEDVDYDREDREVSFDFRGRVSWRNAKVRIYTMGGRKVSRYIIERDNDGIDVKVKRLSIGKKYRYKISGVKRRGAARYTTISGTFRAYDD